MYDDDGRLTHSITTRQPEFTPADTALLIAADMKARQTRSHGIPAEEAMDPANQWAFEGYAVRDWAEKARQDKEAELKKSNPDDPMHGLIVGVRKK